MKFTIMPMSAPRGSAVGPPMNRVAALAVAHSTELALIRIPADTELDQTNVHVGTGNDVEAAEVFVLEVETNSRVTIAFHCKDSESCAAKYDVRVGDGAEMNLVYVNDWDVNAIHGSQTSLGVGRDARTRTVQASLGGAVIRLQESAHSADPNGELGQYGLYFVDAEQHIQHRLLVDHNTPKTRPNMSYRGALQDKSANSVRIGGMLIQKVAEGIETYESNKNPILTDGCQADSIPSPEVETGEAEGAGHSSTTGRFDDLQLFYLRSRDIPETEAKRLVIHGFFNDIIRRIGISEIEERLLVQVEKELNMAAEAMRAAQ